jgi:hypothetical protein
MQRFFIIIGVFTVAFLMILGLNSLYPFLPQGGFIVVDGERIGTWEPGKPAIKLLDAEDPVLFSTEIVPADYFDDIEHKLNLPDPVGPATSLYYTAINYIEGRDGLEGAQEFHEAVEDNIRQGAHKHELAAIVAAIRYAENGRAGREYGALSLYARDTTYRKQAGECAFSVQQNWDRYLTGGPCLNQINGGNCSIEHQPQDSRDIYSFIDYQGHVYCPLGADNDPTGLNHNWTGNVSALYDNLVLKLK